MRIYERKAITNKERTEINRLSNQLPLIEGVGVTPEYHFNKIKDIILDKYHAISKIDRDQQTTFELSKYVNGIMLLKEMYLEQEADGFEPDVFDFVNDDSCYICESKSIIKMTEKESETRYICTKCNSVHVPEDGKMNVFHVQKEKQDDGKHPN